MLQQSARMISWRYQGGLLVGVYTGDAIKDEKAPVFSEQRILVCICFCKYITMPVLTDAV